MTTNEVDVWSQAKPLGAFAGLKPDEDGLGGGIGSAYPIIGYRGKVWSIRANGESHMWLRADDGSPMNYIDVVLLRAPDVKSKSYYQSWEEGTVGKRPICASLDGVKPDSDVQDKQADLCALCPRNEWYTNDKGKKTQDCADYKRLAVLVLPQITTAMFGVPILEPTFLRVPGGSLRDMKAFDDTKAAEGWHYSSYITRISFDPRESYPKFVWKALAPIRDEDFAKIVLELREDAVAKRITGEELAGRGGMRSVSGGGREPVPDEPPHPSTVQRQPPQQPQTVASRPDGQVLELRPQADGSYGERLLPEGFTRDTRTTGVPRDSVTTPASSTPSTVHVVGQTAADVGTSVDDPAMDALIAGLMEV